MLVAGRSGPGQFCPIWARGIATRVENAHAGSKGDPEEGYLGSHDLFGGLGNPKGKFHPLRSLVLVARGSDFVLARCRYRLRDAQAYPY